MFIPAATALKNLVYRIIPTPGQAFHGSVTLTTFFSIFLLFFPPLLFFSARPPQRWTEEGFCGTDFDFWSFSERDGADKRCHGAQPPAVTCGCCDDVSPMGRSPILCISRQNDRGWRDRGDSSAVRDDFALLWQLSPCSSRESEGQLKGHSCKVGPTSWVTLRTNKDEPGTVTSHDTACGVTLRPHQCVVMRTKHGSGHNGGAKHPESASYMSNKIMQIGKVESNEF